MIIGSHVSFIITIISSDGLLYIEKQNKTTTNKKVSKELL